jgi:dynein heavy chain, axonemal
MIEALSQEIDAMLDPLLSRAFVKKGRSFVVKLGNDDIEVANSFKLYL